MVFKKITVGLQNETETDEHWMMFLETSIDVHCITNYFRWWKLSWQSIWFQVINYFKTILNIKIYKYLIFWQNLFNTNTNPDKLSPLPKIVKWNVLILFTKTFPKFLLNKYMHIFSHDTANFRGTVVHNHCICGHIHSLWGTIWYYLFRHIVYSKDSRLDF